MNNVKKLFVCLFVTVFVVNVFAVSGVFASGPKNLTLNMGSISQPIKSNSLKIILLKIPVLPRPIPIPPKLRPKPMPRPIPIPPVPIFPW